MTDKNGLTRGIIVKALVDTLEPLEYVHAFWEAGAAAFNRIDEWSDLDLYLVVDNEKVDETFVTVEESLKSLSSISLKYDVVHPPDSGLFQAFYRLDKASEYLIVDLAVFKMSSPDKFLEPEIHGDAIFYFNKSNMVKLPHLDKDALVRKLRKRLDRLKARFEMFNKFVQKEINRGNYLEALDFYRVFTVAALVEALRIKYNPVHHNFRMHYIHSELPLEIIEKLRSICFVGDEKDLQDRYDEATKWFDGVISEIDEEEIRRRIESK